jgi:hypothetical protein
MSQRDARLQPVETCPRCHSIGVNPATLGDVQGCGVVLREAALAVVGLVGFLFGGAVIAGTAGAWVGLVFGVLLVVVVVIGSFSKIGDTKVKCHDCGLEWWRSKPPEF